MDREQLERQVRALDEGRGALGLEGFRAVLATGADAGTWLQDLVTAGVQGLARGEAVRSLLLSPTGRIRADLHVLRTPEGYLLLQPADQPTGAGDLLGPYVLSSDVTLSPAAPRLVALPGVRGWRFEDPAATTAEPVGVGAEAVEAWRIRRGIARFPVDLDLDSLPAEAGLDDEVVIDRTKGCFLGQESVAKVRNLGHPTRIVLALRATGNVAPGEPVTTRGAEVGLVTSADGLPDGGTALLARVRWDAREDDLRTAAGTRLERR